jgi:hypothetical protein
MYVSVDVSEFQLPVDDTYPHEWFSFRVCDGDYLDHHAAQNLAWAIRARAAGKLHGFTVYVVYRPGENAAVLANLNTLHVPTDCHVMVDVESWRGEIQGDHSREINELVSALARRQGTGSRVWGYGNRGDLGNIWPHRPDWLMVIVASYGGDKPEMPNMIGWQYTDGQYAVPGLPQSTPPFGRCDHNVFYMTQPQEEDVPLTDAEIAKIADKVWSHPHKSGDVEHDMETWTVLAAQRAFAAAVAAKLGGGTGLSTEQIEDAVRAVFADAAAK